jgi:hypothetical protein
MLCGVVFALCDAVFVLVLSIPTSEEREQIRGAFSSFLLSAARKTFFRAGPHRT